MQQSLQLNIIPFTAPVQEAEFAFYTTKHDGDCPIHKDDLNGAIEGLVDESELHYGNWLYTDFAAPKENAIIIPVNLTECKSFAQHYYRHLSTCTCTSRICSASCSTNTYRLISANLKQPNKPKPC